MQLIELGVDVEYIDIDTSKVPYTFSVKLADKTYSFVIRYNDVGGFFTADLSIASTGKLLAYGDPIRYGRPPSKSAVSGTVWTTSILSLTSPLRTATRSRRPHSRRTIFLRRRENPSSGGTSSF